MTDFSVTILGASAARPYPDAPASAAYVQCGGTRLLVDCGEGTLVALERAGRSHAKLDAVCITHTHGDHVYGLPGLLTTMALSGRRAPLDLIGPPPLRAFLDAALAHSHAHLTYELRHHPAGLATPRGAVLAYRDLEVSTLPLRHRVPAVGFRVSTTDKGLRLREGVVERLRIPYATIPAIRRGGDFEAPDGTVHPNSALTRSPAPARSMVYLSDTEPLWAYPSTWPPPTLLVHDATFAAADAPLARKTGHSTVVEAAAFAKTCGAERLLLTHTSARYGDRDALLAEASATFGTTEWAQPGATYAL